MMYNVGVAVVVFKFENDQVYFLLGKRKGSHCAGYWGFPGGHLEENESIFDCAVREVREETNLKIENLHHTFYTDVYYQDIDKNYITLFVVAGLATDSFKEPSLMEPNKCSQWKWVNSVDKNDDIKPLMPGIDNLVSQIRVLL